MSSVLTCEGNSTRPTVSPSHAVPRHDRLTPAQYAFVYYLLDVIRSAGPTDWSLVPRHQALEAYTERIRRPGRRIGNVIQCGRGERRTYRMHRLACKQVPELRSRGLVSEVVSQLIGAGFLLVVHDGESEYLQVTPAALAN